MGNTVVWKPSPTQQFSAHFTMRLLEAAGMPPGVINLVTGNGAAVSEVAVPHPELSGIHFTGSTATFQHLWQAVAKGLPSYRSYPRLVGETGGKDFVLAHPSADPRTLEIALVRGAFEYQGQKCSAASRAYVPRSLWEAGVRDGLADRVRSLTYGDVTDLANFGGAVIDRRAFDRLARVVRDAAADPALEVLAGGSADDIRGLLRRPDRRRRAGPDARGVLPRVLRARCSRCTSTTTPTGLDPRPGRPHGAVRADRRGHRRRPRTPSRGLGPAALHGRQLLRQRQADRAPWSGSSRSAGARQSGTNDKAGLGAEPAALDVAADDEDDVRAAARPRVPAHGMTGRRCRGTVGA
jgi:hypothetical protein